MREAGFCSGDGGARKSAAACAERDERARSAGFCGGGDHTPGTVAIADRDAIEGAAAYGDVGDGTEDIAVGIVRARGAAAIAAQELRRLRNEALVREALKLVRNETPAREKLRLVRNEATWSEALGLVTMEEAKALWLVSMVVVTALLSVKMVEATELRLATMVQGTALRVVLLTLVSTVIGLMMDASGEVSCRGRRLLSTSMKTRVSPNHRVL